MPDFTQHSGRIRDKTEALFINGEASGLGVVPGLKPLNQREGFIVPTFSEDDEDEGNIHQRRENKGLILPDFVVDSALPVGHLQEEGESNGTNERTQGVAAGVLPELPLLEESVCSDGFQINESPEESVIRQVSCLIQNFNHDFIYNNIYKFYLIFQVFNSDFLILLNFGFLLY